MIVLLEQAPENRISPVGQGTAFRKLLLQISAGHRSAGEVNRLCDLVAELVDTLPVYRLSCTPDVRAVNILRTVLEKGGDLMPPSERPLTRYLSYRARNDGIPLSGTFELSPVCNLACRMCYVRRSSAEVAAHPRPIMTLEQWKCLGDEIFDAGTLFLLLTGGEPFLWPDFRELYEYLHRKGFLISVNSNGTLISDDTVGWLRDSPPSCINITLYGVGEEAYERLCGVRGVYSRVTANTTGCWPPGSR